MHAYTALGSGRALPSRCVCCRAPKIGGSYDLFSMRNEVECLSYPKLCLNVHTISRSQLCSLWRLALTKLVRTACRNHARCLPACRYQPPRPDFSIGGSGRPLSASQDRPLSHAEQLILKGKDIATRSSLIGVPTTQPGARDTLVHSCVRGDAQIVSLCRLPCTLFSVCLPGSSATHTL